MKKFSELTIAIERTEVQVGAGVVDEDVLGISAEQRMGDDGRKGKN